MKIIQRAIIALILGVSLLGCNNDLGYEPPTQKLNSSEVSSEVAAPTGDNLKSLSTLKHKTDLSFNGHEDNLQSVNGIASKATSPSTGLTAPALMAGMSGSNISYCVYNSEDRSIYLNTEGTLQKAAYQKDWFEVPSHTSGCLDKVTFDGTDIHPVKVSFSADGSSPFITYLHYRQDNQIINGDNDNQGYFAYFADYKVDAKGVWQADNDKEFTVDDASILKGNGFGVQDNSIVNN